ncbi:MAG: aminopeptidase P family N-terminal domain-containing protein [Planctomycetota bacterium]|nr:aminopeptidase P family N-terminal domain-containing protein [Planctomycetota bacterium]
MNDAMNRHDAPTGWREKDERTLVEVRRLLARDRLDAILPWKAAHRAYLLNFFDAVHADVPWEEMATFLVLPLEGDPFISGSHEHVAGRVPYGVCPGWLKPENRSGEWWGCDENLAVFVGEMKRRGLARARVGYEKKWLPVAMFEKLRAALPDVTWVPADTIVPQVRLVKTPREQALMRRAVVGGFAAMEAYCSALRSGATLEEAQLARAHRALDAGVEWVGGAMRMAWTGGTFETLDWWDAPAREQIRRSPVGRNWLLLPDDAPICVTHFETRCQFYFSDIAWHEFLGPAPSDGDRVVWSADSEPMRLFAWRDLVRDFEVMRVVQREAINQIRIGMDQAEARAAVERYLAGNADYQEHGRGYFIHSLGLEIHEEPILAAANPNALPVDGPILFQPGAVCSSEWFSRHWTVEDPFVLGADGKWEPLAPLRGVTG